MKIESTVNAVRNQVKEWRKSGLTVGFVPTMGYLHEGHASLIQAARENNDKVVVSIFVNPMQFGPTEDLASYPRDLEKDSALCASLGADLIFHPEPEEMYHEGFSSYVDMDVLTQELCGLSRPVHFRGVCTVVCKLFHIVAPDRAYFGQKDAQQKIVDAMKERIASEPLARIDYVKAVDGRTMQQIQTVQKPMLVAIAVYIGSTRLIDNFIWE